jgi:hypothetical protein
MLYEEIIAVYSENPARLTNTKFRVTECGTYNCHWALSG